MRAAIPAGPMTPRMLGGIPLEASAVLCVVVGVPWVIYKHAWALALVVPLWSFLRYHARKEPLFLKIWAGQLVFKRYYLHG